MMTDSENNLIKPKPWFKFPYVWMLIILLGSAVSASLYTVKIALSLPNDVLPVELAKFALEGEESAQTVAPAPAKVETP